MLSLFLLLAPSGNVFALKTPTPTELNVLQSQINTVQALQGNATDPNPLNWTGIVGLDRSILEEGAQIDPDKKKIAAWEQRRQSLKLQQASLCQSLLENTRFAYGIKPNRYSGKIVLPGGFKDTYADYRPRFGEMKQTHEKLNRGGHMIAMGYPGSYAAITWENGDIIVTIDAFKFSPGYLAAVITHETIHYDQITTVGRGNKMSRQAREREAYNTMIGLTNRPIFQLSPMELGVVKDNFHRAMNSTSPSDSSPLLGDSGFYSVDLTLDPNGEEHLLQAMREAKEVAAKQRERIELERQRDHDERLKNAWVALAQRSCANPGSVSQAELDRLPKPYGTDVMDTTPRGLGECGGKVYSMLSYGASAEEIRGMSTPPPKPVDALIPPPPQAARPDPQPQQGAQAQTPFSSVLPGLKNIAVTACLSSGQVPIEKNLTQPDMPFSFWKEMDDKTADSLSSGLGNCEGRLFRRLIELIRAGQGDRITALWVQQTAAAYRNTAGTSPGHAAPPSRSCEDYGNIRCP